MKNKETMGLKGWFVINHFDSDGKLIEQVTTPNTIMNVGLAEVSGLMLSDVGGTAFDYIALGTGTTAAAATQTELVTEITENGGERAASTGTQETDTVSNDTAQFVNTFSFTGSYAVTESAILNADTAGDMLARQTFSAINVASGDSLEVTWKVVLS